MANTKIDICNQALIKLGADTISSLDVSQNLDDGTIQSAKLCNILYPQALDEILRLYPWNACTSSNQPTKLQTVPTFYTAAFQLPNDCVRILNVFDSTNASYNISEWVIEGDEIQCNESIIYIRYIARPDNVGILDSLASRALICHLAAKLAPALQLDEDWSTKLTNELYQVILPEARSIDTFENKKFLMEESNWINSRDEDYPVSY